MRVLGESLYLLEEDHDFVLTTIVCRMNRRKADFKFAYKFLEDDL